MLVREALRYQCGLGIIIAVTLGLRIGEVLGLRWSDYNRQARTLKIDRQLEERPGLPEAPPKKNSYRELPVPPLLAALLDARFSEIIKAGRFPYWIVEGALGQPITHRNARRALAGLIVSWNTIQTGPFACDTCGASYATNDGLRMHRWRSHQIPQQEYQPPRRPDAECLPDDLTWHDLRHTFTTRLLGVGADISIRRKALGHKGGDVTERYTHATIEMLRPWIDAAEPREPDDAQQVM